MESKAFLINQAIELGSFVEVIENNLKKLVGVEDLDEVLPEGWRGSIVQCYKESMDEIYTYEEVNGLVEWYSSELGNSIMSKFFEMQSSIEPKLQKVFQG